MAKQTKNLRILPNYSKV